MKLSESLLYEKEIGQKIFISRLNKAKRLLSEVFEINFDIDDSKILNTKETYLKYEILFKLKNRRLIAIFTFEKDYEDILKEVLKIQEKEVTCIPITIDDGKNNFKDIIKKIMAKLEEKYDINFIPLDPEEDDKNIKKVISNEVEGLWEATFTSDNNESEFKVKYQQIDNNVEPSFELTEYKQHLIYLD